MIYPTSTTATEATDTMGSSYEVFELLLPQLSAFVSIVGSSLIVGEVVQDWRQQGKKLGAVSRTLLCMSIGDLLFSFAWFIASFVISGEEDPAMRHMEPTSGACKFQAFLLQMGFFASISFNGSLAIIYLLMIRHNWNAQRLIRVFKPVAIFLWTVSFVIALVPLFLDLYHDAGPLCWIASNDGYDVSNLVAFLQMVPIWTCTIMDAIIMFMVYRKTKELEKAALASSFFGFDDGNNNNNNNNNNAPDLDNSSINNDITDSGDRLSDTGGSLSDHHHNQQPPQPLAVHHEADDEESQPPQQPQPVEADVASSPEEQAPDLESSANSNSHNSNSNNLPTTDEKSQNTNDDDDDETTRTLSNKASRVAAVQGMWYISGFFLTYGFATLSAIVYLITGGYSQPLYRMSYFFLALQGLWNFLIFSRGRREMKTWLGRKFHYLIWQGGIFSLCCCCTIECKKAGEPDHRPRDALPGDTLRWTNESTTLHANKKKTTLLSAVSNASTVVHSNRNLQPGGGSAGNLSIGNDLSNSNSNSDGTSNGGVIRPVSREGSAKFLAPQPLVVEDRGQRWSARSSTNTGTSSMRPPAAPKRENSLENSDTHSISEFCDEHDKASVSELSNPSLGSLEKLCHRQSKQAAAVYQYQQQQQQQQQQRYRDAPDMDHLATAVNRINFGSGIMAPHSHQRPPPASSERYHTYGRSNPQSSSESDYTPASSGIAGLYNPHQPQPHRHHYQKQQQQHPSSEQHYYGSSPSNTNNDYYYNSSPPPRSSSPVTPSYNNYHHHNEKNIRHNNNSTTIHMNANVSPYNAPYEPLSPPVFEKRSKQKDQNQGIPAEVSDADLSSADGDDMSSITNTLAEEKKINLRVFGVPLPASSLRGVLKNAGEVIPMSSGSSYASSNDDEVEDLPHVDSGEAIVGSKAPKSPVATSTPPPPQQQGEAENEMALKTDGPAGEEVVLSAPLGMATKGDEVVPDNNEPVAAIDVNEEHAKQTQTEPPNGNNDVEDAEQS